MKFLDEQGHQKTEMKDLMDIAHAVKMESEINNMRAATKFLQWTFSKIVDEVEDIIDTEK